MHYEEKIRKQVCIITGTGGSIGRAAALRFAEEGALVVGRVVFGTGKYGSLAPKLPEPIPSWSPIKYFGGYYTGN